MRAFSLIIPFILIKAIYLFLEEDKVSGLPDYSYNGTLYSGYLDVSEIKKFHYLLNIAIDDWEHKPLVLWLNGGPGCSSLDGWVNEHGPMLIDKNGKFQLNNYTWVKEANIIYLESPGNVGFSLINSTNKDDLYVDDNTTAADNLIALLDFFRKYPEFKTKDFYVSGESYAGIYVPMLAYKIIEYNKKPETTEKIKLKGILVGNGVTDWKYDVEPARMDFFFTHHLTSYEHRLNYVKYCLTNKTRDEVECNKIIDEAYEIIDGVNIYDYLQDCQVSDKSKGELSTKPTYYLRAPWAFKTFKKINKKILTLNEEQEDEEDTVPCLDDTKMEKYFSREDVQNALHVRRIENWYVCSDTILKNYNILDEGSIWTYPTLINEGLKILIYSGDTDIAVPFNGNQMWIKNLKLEIEEPWRSWRVENDTNNIAGYVVKYKGLIFCTIKGTGHMAPGWKPKESFHMYSKFLKNEAI